MWVTTLEMFSDSMPPMAIVAPTMASLSMLGISAQDRITSEKIILGSGENGRIWASLFFASEAVIQLDLTTGSIVAVASVNSGKSIVLEMMWVTVLSGSEPPRF